MGRGLGEVGLMAPIFFQLNNFLVIELTDLNKKWGDRGVKVGLFVKDRLKPIITLFVTELLPTLQFLLPTVNFTPKCHQPCHSYAQRLL